MTLSPLSCQPAERGSAVGRRRRREGIQVRHTRACRSREGGGCNCEPSYQAEVYDPGAGKKRRRTFPTEAAARAWRIDAMREMRGRRRGMGTDMTVAQAAEIWLAGVEDGTIRAKRRGEYKPSVKREYRRILHRDLLPRFGAVRLDRLTRNDIQNYVDELIRSGKSPSTIASAVMPLRGIYNRALRRGEIIQSPMVGLDMPAYETQPMRIAAPAEAMMLLAAVPEADRSIWATAMFAGLRRGELQALDWEAIDFDAGLLRVERAYDSVARLFIAPKSRAGERTVPIVPQLREFLEPLSPAPGESRRRLVWTQEDGVTPFSDASIGYRAKRDWARHGRQPIRLHECRHTFASLLIAAGANAKAISKIMGHESIQITFDRYGHMLPGAEEEVGELLDAFLRGQLDS